MDLLEKECIVISAKNELLRLCNKYGIPNVGVDTHVFEPHSGGDQEVYLISRKGVKEYDEDNQPSGLTVFKTRECLKYYLFKTALYNGKIIVHKSNYITYLKTIRLLKKIGIKAIKDKTYFQEAYSFYVICNTFKELNLFGTKCAVTVANGIQYTSSEFLSYLKDYIKNKINYENEIYVYNRGEN